MLDLLRPYQCRAPSVNGPNVTVFHSQFNIRQHKYKNLQENKDNPPVRALTGVGKLIIRYDWHFFGSQSARGWNFQALLLVWLISLNRTGELDGQRHLSSSRRRACPRTAVLAQLRWQISLSRDWSPQSCRWRAKFRFINQKLPGTSRDLITAGKHTFYLHKSSLRQ